MMNVYILQEDATDVNGLETTVSPNPHDHELPFGAQGGSGLYSNNCLDMSKKPKTTPVNLTVTLSSSDKETRPINSTFIIWRRTA
jgi:hypothetical protein